METYVVVLDARPGVYARLLSEPESARVAGEVDSAASATGIHLHVVWPNAGALRLIVGSDGDPESFVEYLAERLEDGSWDGTWQSVSLPEDIPADLEGGQLSDWIVENAVPPAIRRCELCQRVGVPPHGPGCAYQREDDERPVGQQLDLGRDGPEARALGEEKAEAEAEPAGAG